MPSKIETTPGVTVRPATPADVPAILHFIRELAAFERSLDQVQATEADLLRDGWGLGPDGLPNDNRGHAPAPPRFRALMAEAATGHAEPLGFALYFNTYSTWVGHHGIRLEDLYVTPAHRGQGIGKALLARLARIALEEGCTRLEWDVLTWNEPAIAVYRRLGATTKDEWHVMRLADDALTALAATDTTR